MSERQRVKASGVSFDGILLRRAVFDDIGLERPEGLKEQKSLNVNLEVTYGQMKDPQHAFVRLTFSATPDKDPTLFKQLIVVLDGLFSVPADGDVEQLQKFCQASGPSLLMPYVRQAVTNLTAFSQAQAIILPPLNLTRVLPAEAVQSALPAAEAGG